MSGGSSGMSGGSSGMSGGSSGMSGGSSGMSGGSSGMSSGTADFLWSSSVDSDGYSDISRSASSSDDEDNDAHLCDRCALVAQNSDNYPGAFGLDRVEFPPVATVRRRIQLAGGSIGPFVLMLHMFLKFGACITLMHSTDIPENLPAMMATYIITDYASIGPWFAAYDAIRAMCAQLVCNRVRTFVYDILTDGFLRFRERSPACPITELVNCLVLCVKALTIPLLHEELEKVKILERPENRISDVFNAHIAICFILDVCAANHFKMADGQVRVLLHGTSGGIMNSLDALASHLVDDSADPVMFAMFRTYRYLRTEHDRLRQFAGLT
jgi:hypothetical protein